MENEGITLNGVTLNGEFGNIFSYEHPVELRVMVQEDVPEVINVIYNPPATIIMFDDGSKSVAKCHPSDEFDAIIGFNSAFTKRFISTKERGKLIDNAEWQGLTDKAE